MRRARRRCSLLETKKRFFFTSLRIRFLDTRLRKRLSKLSCDSPGLSTTLVTYDSPPSKYIFHYRLLQQNRPGWPQPTTGFGANQVYRVLEPNYRKSQIVSNRTWDNLLSTHLRQTGKCRRRRPPTPIGSDCQDNHSRSLSGQANSMVAGVIKTSHSHDLSFAQEPQRNSL